MGVPWLAVAGIGLNLFSMFSNNRRQDKAQQEAYHQRMMELRRAKISMHARRALGKIQYHEGTRRNLDSASDAIEINTQKWNSLLDANRWKEFELYRKTSMNKASLSSQGMTGQSIQRAEAIMDNAQPGITKTHAATVLASKGWALNAERKGIWKQYEESDEMTYDDSQIGRLQTIGSAPRRPPSRWRSDVAGAAGIIGDYLMNKYRPKENTPAGVGLTNTNYYQPYNYSSNINYWNTGWTGFTNPSTFSGGWSPPPGFYNSPTPSRVSFANTVQ
tara:strand:+ start:4673 stop:5497 length:825 start_codon:yes stop_codon:yes gene_type:complete